MVERRSTTGGKGERNSGMGQEMMRAKKGTRRKRRKRREQKNKAFQDLYERLEMKEGVNEVFQIAK